MLFSQTKETDSTGLPGGKEVRRRAANAKLARLVGRAVNVSRLIASARGTDDQWFYANLHNGPEEAQLAAIMPLLVQYPFPRGQTWMAQVLHLRGLLAKLAPAAGPVDYARQRHAESYDYRWRSSQSLQYEFKSSKDFRNYVLCAANDGTLPLNGKDLAELLEDVGILSPMVPLLPQNFDLWA